MKKLLITLLLISPASFADWGDVYYCQMTNFSAVTFEGKGTNYMLDKFTFKLEKTKNAIVFGKDGYFDKYEIELEKDVFPQQELLWANSSTGKLFFEEGKFLFVSVSGEDANTISATCDKF